MKDGMDLFCLHIIKTVFVEKREIYKNLVHCKGIVLRKWYSSLNEQMTTQNWNHKNFFHVNAYFYEVLVEPAV